MKRRLLALTLLAAFVSATVAVGVGVAQSGPPEVPDELRAFSIVPPGQEGEITSTEFASGNYGAHYDDQLGVYSGLVKDDDVTEEELATHFHGMQFGPGTEIERTYSPTTGVTVYRDNMGIPHIYADDLNKASYALGYVAAEDRLWEMDIFRHAGRGTLAELIGPGENDQYLEMDIATRREGYTPEEVINMYDQWDNKFGALGDQLQGGLREYAAGVNKYIGELRTRPDKCSVEYSATGNPCPEPNPTDWNVSDTLFLVILQLRIFGETAGAEFENAGLYSHLQQRLGKKKGARVYNDFLFQNDKRSPTTITPSEGRYPSQNLGRINKRSVAIPDQAAKEAEQQRRAEEQREAALRSLGFPTGAMSNSLTVSGDETTSGNPMQIGAPQVGYAVPSFFMDVDVHVPSANVHYRGPAVPAANTLIPLGRGADYAWTLTTGFSDAVDVKVEKLCDPKGGEVKKESEHYIYKGKCRKMQKREEVFTVKATPPPPGTENPPRTETHTFYRTVHGPVFDRGTVKGKPVAFVKNRFFWKKELDSVAAFYKWNTHVRDIDDFRKAASEFSMNFNAFYADAKDIGWFHVGYMPKRPKGMHPSLPTWGTGRWEFKGRFPFRKHPQVVNPEQGWIANWNNKPSIGWKNTDHCCGGKFGAIQRVKLLQDQMHKLVDGSGKAELSDLVDVIRTGATQDTRGVYLGNSMTNWARDVGRTDQNLTAALGAVRTWISNGAHRYNKDDNEENMDDAAALALFDEWYNRMVHKIYDDELGKDGYELLRTPVTDYAPTGGSSFFFDFSSYLANLFHPTRKKKLAFDYCNDGKTKPRETCKQIVADTFKEAYDALVKDQGADMSAWEVPAENILFQELGAGSVDPIPWQNRGTHNHVVEILSDANLPPYVVPEPSPSGSSPRPTGSSSPSPSPSGSGP